MISKQNREWLKEYSEFLQTDLTPVPNEVTRRVWSQIGSLLHPNALLVFAKLLSVHLVTGFLSLGVCNQFGVNPFNTTWSLADVFMNFGGHGFCMVVCGGLFFSISFLTAGFLLSVEEVKALRRTEILQFSALAVVSMGLFVAGGADFALTYSGLWLAGGLIGGALTIEVLWRLKRA